MPALSDAARYIAREDLAACRMLLRGGSRTFFAASLLLPPAVRDPASALYAFCRLADDAVDLDTTAPAAAIERLRERLERVYAGRPLQLPVDRAFAATVARFDIPRTFPEALIEGFAWDVAGRQYETMADLNGYGARVAGSVGAMMSLVMERESPVLLARACELGMAMQLSNIARDVGEDARLGRLYLPRQWMREAGIDPDAWLDQPAFTPALGLVVQRLLAEADRLYALSGTGIAGLPFWCRPGIRAARFLYAEIGDQVERCAFDSVSRRAVVPPLRKAVVLAQSLVARDRGMDGTSSPVHAQARFLIDALSDRGAAALSQPLGGRIAWLVDLFERLERQDRLRLKPTAAAAGHRAHPARGRYPQRPHPAARLRKLEC
jgi:phytoene synthase